VAEEALLTRTGMRRVIVGWVAFVGLFLLGVWVAEAYPEDGGYNCAPRDTVTWNYKPPSTFNSTQRAEIEAGFDLWESSLPPDHAGNPLVDLVKFQSAGQVKVEWRNLDKLGKTRCNRDEEPYRIELDDSLQSGSVLLTEVASHEMGHAFGLGHTGKKESYQGIYRTTLDHPLMSCSIENGMSIEGDDKAATSYILQQEFNNVGQPWNVRRTIHADPSFESGSANAWSSNHGPISILSTGGSDGAYFALLPAENNWIAQTARFADGTGENSDVDARVNAKMAGSTAGSVEIRVKARRVEYEDRPTGNECEWQRIDPDESADLPKLTSYPNLTRATLTCSVTDNTWDPPPADLCTTAVWVMPKAWTTGAVQVKVFNRSASIPPLHVDFVRARGE